MTLEVDDGLVVGGVTTVTGLATGVGEGIGKTGAIGAVTGGGGAGATKGRGDELVTTVGGGGGGVSEGIFCFSFVSRLCGDADFA